MICECISLLRGKSGNNFGSKQDVPNVNLSCRQMEELVDHRRLIVVARLGEWTEI